MLNVKLLFNFPSKFMERVLLKNPIIAFFKLVRIENLLVIATTMICVKYFVFEPVNDFSKLTPFLFSILVVSTVLIAAAGNIINDYFDVKTDKINRPDTVVLDVTIKRRWAMILHIAFNAVGLLLGLYLALACHQLKLVLFQLISVVLLWFYSTNFKKQLLIGNIIVACLTASIPILPMVYDYYISGPINAWVEMMIGSYLNKFPIVVFAYAIFAFLMTLVREIIKDMEDYKGDIETGGKTMPIAWGMITSKVFVFFTIVITIGLLLLSAFKFYKEDQVISVYYILGLLIFPLIILMLLIIKAQTKRQYSASSLLLKFIMLFGIAFTSILKF